ncbi:hypothetical protein BJX63DRAFT_437744 [Aspergillus granulosus]|uniref:Azaphilone pigments biosynthesis cluster protein L N-terminal domain-containing protein n=1 Tax=Aspergillus granulosus TaxID=176169 RepID=A0ABR4GU50_9EURO
MADPVSIIAPVRAIITAAVQSTNLLKETIRHFREHIRALGKLQDELEDPQRFLDLLEHAVDADISVPEFLQGVIGEFEVSMKIFHEKSRTGFRDWTGMEFMNGYIDEFIETIVTYKSTISVHLDVLVIAYAQSLLSGSSRVQRDGSSKSLCRTIEDIQNNNDLVRNLQDEVEALCRVLEHLEQVVRKYEVKLSPLSLPLMRCDTICEELSDLITKYAKHTHWQKASLQDWSKFRYKGDDIAGVRNIINIALTRVTMLPGTLSSEALRDYEGMIENTRSKFQEYLDKIDAKLHSLEPNTVI